MNNPERVDRFAEAVALEIQNGNLRMPIWTQAMIVANGDAEKAKVLYTAMRVQQMEQDELAQTATRTAKANRDKVETVQPRLLSKLFLLGLISFLFLALAYILSQFRGR